MRILGMGVPEMLIGFMAFVVAILPIALLVTIIVLLVKRTHASSQPQSQPLDEGQRANAFAYQRLSQLDDLRKRGAITDEEYASKKQELMRDL